MAPPKGKRRPKSQKSVDIDGDAGDQIDVPKEHKSQQEIEREREKEAHKQKVREQYKKDLKDPEGRRDREKQAVEDYIKKKSKGGEILMSLEDKDKLSGKLWSPTIYYLSEIMKEFGWEIVFDQKRVYLGYLWKQSKSKSK